MAGAQFDSLPYEEGRKWELLEGELIEVPSPTPEHQLIVSTFCASLRQYFHFILRLNRSGIFKVHPSFFVPFYLGYQIQNRSNNFF